MEAVEPRRLMSALPCISVNGTSVDSLVGGVISTVTGTERAVITAVPVSLSAGGGAVVTVQLQDATGHVDLTQSITVTLSIAAGPAGATLGGTTTVSAVNGVATFPNVVLTDAGTYLLQATAAGMAIGTSTAVHVTAAAASQLAVISQPVLAALGQAIAPVVVAVEDAYGNVVATDSSVVNLAAEVDASVHGTTATVGMNATTSTATAVNGIATFSNVTIPTVGTHVLTATDATLAAAKSATVTIDVPKPIATPSTTPTRTPTATVTSPIAIVVAGAKGSSIAVDVSASLPALSAQAQGAQSVQVSVSASDGSIVMSTTAHVKAGVALLPAFKTHVAGTYSVVLTDAAGESLTESLVVQAAAAAKMVFTTLPTLLDGKATVALQVLDKWGNVTTADDGSTVTLSLAKGSTFGRAAALAGATVATVKDGIATFAGGLSVSSSINPGGYSKLAVSLGKLTATTAATYTIA